MKLQLFSGAVPADGDVIKCEGSRQCSSHDEQDGSIDDSWHPGGDVDKNGCYRLLKQLQDKYAEVHYNWMIAFWMMEGYLGHVDSVDQAYRKGHDIFMECTYNVEKKPPEQVEVCLNTTSDYWRYRESVSRYTNILGLGDVLGSADLAEFGELVPHNGVLTTLKRDDHRPWIRRSLLLDGVPQHRQVLRYINPDLKYLAYFNPNHNLLQHTLKLPGLNLSVLILRGCEFVEEIDESIGMMSALTVLEISGPCSSISQIPDHIFSKLTRLRSLNLSHLSNIQALPKSFPKLVNLRRLILRGCCRLTELPSTKNMAKIEVIDLHGAKSLTNLTTTRLNESPVQMLDLSHTRVRRVPRLFSPGKTPSAVTHLFLKNCYEISVFDIVKEFPNLQVLDLSGATRLEHIRTFKPLRHLLVLDLSQTSLHSFPEEGLPTMNKLQHLNLSNTCLVSVPTISHLSCLVRLRVGGCKRLERLEMKGLVSLEILDASGCEMLQGLGDLSDLRKLLSLDLSGCSSLRRVDLRHLSTLHSLNLSSTSVENFAVFSLSNGDRLQILNLSETNIRSINSVTRLKSLKQLLLAGCWQLASLPDLGELTELQVLDLSRTNIGKEFLDHVPISLQKLLLRDCRRIEGSLALATLTQLRELDLQGSDMAEFPYDIKGMTRLERLRLPRKIDIIGVDWSRVTACLPEQTVWDQPLNIFESVDVVISNGVDHEHSMSAKPSYHSHLFRLVDRRDSWEAYFKGFHFSAVSPKEEGKDAVISFGGVELVFKGQHPWATTEPYVKPRCGSVEIHGFSRFPEDTRTALEKAVNVALVGSSFISSLSDECFGYMEAMKVCWIKSCTKMEFVLGGEIHDDGVFGGLGWFNDNELGGETQNGGGVLGSLETLVLSNLAILKAFCAESTDVRSQSNESLKHMYIDCCPVLDKIISSSHLPENLETLHIKFCDELEVVVCDETDSECELAELHELSLIDLPKLQRIGARLPFLQRLVIRQCPKFNALGSVLECAGSRLTRLSLDSCPQLERVFSSSVLPGNIRELEIRSCDELAAVFESAELAPSSLPSLVRLQLWNLPKLKSIGGGFPSLEACEIKYCSRLPRQLWPQVKTPNQ